MRMLLAGLVLLCACSQTAAPAGPFACQECLHDSDCTGGSTCVQFGADTACAPACTAAAAACGDTAACTSLSTPAGDQVSVCIPDGELCGAQATPDAAPMSGACGGLLGPDTAACCHSCSPGANCQANGCYGGWWCNSAACHCQAPPSSCGGGGGGTDAVKVGDPPTGTVTSTGGTVSRLYFAVIGDTRPAIKNDTANYPSDVIGKLYGDLQALSPRPEFAVATGDYNFASGSEASAQLSKYMTARGKFANPTFFAMGNHECTGYTSSNCGTGNKDGRSANYDAFVSQMMGSIGQTTPYYSIHVAATDASWTAKFVVIAANAWDSAQASWLTTEMAKPTTYTFVIRHEPSSANTAPGVTPSDAIISAKPYTLLLVGHTHLYRHYTGEREVVMGLGGAPVTSGDDFGYLVASQAADGSIVVSEYDYMTGRPNNTFTVMPDGSSGP